MPIYKQSCSMCRSSDVLSGKDESDVQQQHLSSKRHKELSSALDKVNNRVSEMEHGKDHN